jgi:L-ascorbate metabolism protein UlaG (beta-lactamase superfamily)
MKIEQIRHGTVILHIGGKKLLVDPVLADKGTISPIEGVPNADWNPLVPLPVPISHVTDCDAVLVTHTHRDHFDDKAEELLDKSIPLFCQPEDGGKIRSRGFLSVTAVKDRFPWGGMTFHRTGGRHGYGAISLKMAPVSGFVIAAPGEPVVYLTGDTVWCACTRKAMDEFKPDIVICNCGEAKFAHGRAITMGTADIRRICEGYPAAKVVAVHMEAWNHCRLSRQALQEFAVSNAFEKQVFIPKDGEMLEFAL